MIARTNRAAGWLLIGVLSAAGMQLSGCSGDGTAEVVTRAMIRGTVLDRATGAAVPGARIEFPDGRSTTSSEDGRFELGDFEPGTVGQLRAQTQDGRSAVLVIRPLRAGALEVVLHVGV